MHTTPPRRQRTLTGPLDPSHESIWHRFQLFSGVESERHTYEQNNSAFFSKLPLDIRLLIYELVLGGMLLHISAANRRSRIFFETCQRPEAINEPKHQCNEVTIQRPTSAPRDDYAQATGLLQLLVTCRRAYSEAIDVLYSENTFDLHQNHAAFRFLKLMIPSQRLHSIRHFRMRMQIPHHPNVNFRSRRDWDDLFAFLSNDMTGLQSLHLTLGMLQPAQEHIKQTVDTEGSAWIKPMMLMVIRANSKRGCKVELVTNGYVHDLFRVFKDVAHDNEFSNDDRILSLTCIAVHERIRLSLCCHG